MAAEGFRPRTPTPADLTRQVAAQVGVGDRVWFGDRVREVTAADPHGEVAVLVEFDHSPDDSLLLEDGAYLDVVDMAFFFLTAEEGLARAPHRISEEAFCERFRPLRDADGSVQVFDSVPSGVGDALVWSQVEDETGGWRDFALLPGARFRHDAINYVVCEVPYAEADETVEVNWN